VLDPFGGSGTTMIAAERTGRRAALLELDPAYADVIVQRWQAETGEPAILDGEDRSFAEVATARLSAATQQSGHQRGSPTPETPEPQKCPIANLKNRKHERS